MQNIKLGVIRKYAATWTVKGKFKCINTDNLELAEKKVILNNGVLWDNKKYEAAKRLQRMYLTLFYNGRYDETKADYPNLLKIKN